MNWGAEVRVGQTSSHDLPRAGLFTRIQNIAVRALRVKPARGNKITSTKYLNT